MPTSFFEGHSVIAGGVFTQVNNTVQQQRQTPWDRLESAVAPAAFHNSAERLDPPRCRPDTRVTILDQLRNWVMRRGDAGDARILWLNAPAGFGKSAVLQTLSEECFSANALLAGFFFDRSDPARNNVKSFVPTITYQIWCSVPQKYRHLILDVIEDDPLVFKRTVDAQFKALIMGPLQDLINSRYFNSAPCLIVVDGLDECSSAPMQVDILTALRNVSKQAECPFQFLIASRPEDGIQTFFRTSNLGSLLHQLRLDDSYYPGVDFQLNWINTLETRTSHSAGQPFNAVIVRKYSGIEALSKSIASAAIHNSAARQNPPRCHLLTRNDVLGDIMSWIKNSTRKKSIIWLNGSAGAGKSAILQTLAETCAAQGLLAASFFFSRYSESAAPSTNTNTGERFFATIAYQLAVAIDGLQEHVDEVVRADPSIATKAMKRQMERLILGPMNALLKPQRGKLNEPRLPPVIIIDALDECANENQKMNILRLLLDASSGRRNAFPFCIVISSRVEFAMIENLFSSSKFQHITRTIALDDRRDTKATHEEIRAYLRAEFDSIRSSDPIYETRLGNANTPWPSDYIINMLASKSSGQFVYASTVIDFVSNPDCSPDDQLRIMLVLLTGRSSPVSTPASSPYGSTIHCSSSSLIADTEARNSPDSLYRDILEKCTNRKRALSVLGHVLAMMQVADAYCATWGAPLSADIVLHVIDHFLRLNPGDCEFTVRRLQPLISLSRLKELKNQRAVAGQVPGSVVSNMPARNIRQRSVDEHIVSLAGAAINLNHASFFDFLQNPARAGQFSIKLSGVHADITSACLRVMSAFKGENATKTNISFGSMPCFSGPITAPKWKDDKNARKS
ncbi:hypothetical protein D9619_008242 [Psilocybe cf. subviscida]|uniref:Nephrocystin 3-like N-terminal domain-containing protein n=1 Tax=Psilocybe cf. subviscida TaxID=2480587 RepID=A0A8H5ATG4_9AGAR|nr:hypothetical protein D9619_008242 [Psilocybe cf. subviscida]